MMKIRRILLVTFAAALCAADFGAPHFRGADYIAHVKYLASPELRGRATGSPELEEAAAYIAQHFKEDGLQPVEGSSYLQPFEVTTNARLGDGNELTYSAPEGSSTLRFRQDFIPLNFSSEGTFTAGAVFAGYGITANEYHYDDYMHLNVKGKFVILLRHEPQEYDDDSVFAGKVYTQHSELFSKAVNAKLHGALGVILVNDSPNHAGSDNLENFATTVGPSNAGIPFVQVKEAVAEKWFELAGKSIRGTMEAIDKDLTPESFSLPPSFTVTMHIDLRREVKTVHNVIGYLPGETPEYIVIGAHYDHLGLGEQYSMAPSMAGTVHPGADDNASGTAGVLELAHWFGSRPKPHRGIIFMTFAGEELGLLGSSYYVNHPEFPLDKTIAMINMDMIGRIRNHKVYVGGTGTGTTFKPLLEELSKNTPLDIELSDKTGYGSSDHTSFTAKQVPVLFFFSGLHGDYHKPSDTWDKINSDEAATLLDYIANLTVRLAQDDKAPQYVRIDEPHPVGDSAGGGSGYGPYFGSIPDFAEPPTGVRFADVHSDSPAGKAGLKGGDILVEFDGKPIQNLYDFTYALRSKQPGDKVHVKVLRDGKPLEADVTLVPRQ